MKPQTHQARFSRACRAVLAGRFARADADFAAFASIPMADLGRLGRLESPSPADHPKLYERLDAFLIARPRCAWGRVFRSFALRSQMRYLESIAEFESAAASAPDSPALWALLARMRFVHRYPPEGLRDLERAIALAPESGWVRSWLGEARRHQGDLKGALASLDEGIRLDPWFAQAYVWRAAVLDGLGRPAAALKDLNEAIRRDRREAWPYHQRMRLRRASGDARGALKDAAEAHRRNVKFGWIVGRPQQDGTAADALADADRILGAHPGWPWAHAWRGWTLLSSGRAEGALTALSRAAASKRHSWILTWKAQAELLLGRPADALKDLDDALRRGPPYVPAHALRAEALSGLGRPRDAERAFERAVALDPLSAPAHYGLARVRRDLKKFKSASDSLERALKIMPDHEEAVLLKSELARRPGAA
jgi:tetratricopeptide (TPR) repeat protein